MRTFISINIPEEIRKEIKKVQDFLPEFFGKKTELENLHLTLKFLGEIGEERIREVKKKLGEIKYNSFETGIGYVGVFDNRNSKVYKKRMITWLHIKNCSGLQKVVDEKMNEVGFDKEKRFMGHLTIARVKDVKDKKKFLDEFGKVEVPGMKFWVNEFYLMKSELTAEGPRYSVLEEYNLN